VRRSIPFLVLLLAATAQSQNLTEKIDVSLVNVDVTVTSHGAPARGLTRDDFEVLEDGIPQSITHFYAIENAREKTAAAQTAAPTVAAPEPAPVDERFRRKVLIVIDNRHMSRHNRDVALHNIEQFINDRFDSGAYDWSVAMISDGAHLLLPLTSDKARIHAALGEIRAAMAGRAMRDIYRIENRVALVTHDDKSNESVGYIPSGGPSLNSLIERGERFQKSADSMATYRSIRDVTRAFSTQPGRKIVLLVTGPFGDLTDTPLTALDASLSAETAGGIESVRQWLVREANLSNISFYVINAEGYIPNNFGADVHGPDDVFSPAFSAPGVGVPVSTSALQWLAGETGGRALMGNFTDRSLRDFDADSANFYSLAYTPNHGEDGKYHRITVRLTKPGRYTLAYRNGYSTLPIERQLERVMTSAMASGLQPSSIPVNLTTGDATAGDVRGSVLVPLQATVSAKQLQFLPAADGSIARVDVLVSLFNERGRLIKTFRTVREAHAKQGTEGDGNFTETRSLRLRKGVPYRVVVAIHDQVSDAVGIKSQTVRF